MVMAQNGDTLSLIDQNIVKYTNTTDINSQNDLNVSILFANNHLPGDGFPIVWYDADDTQMVVSIVSCRISSIRTCGMTRLAHRSAKLRRRSKISPTFSNEPSRG